jgi:hypothetical protein
MGANIPLPSLESLSSVVIQYGVPVPVGSIAESDAPLRPDDFLG